MRVVAILSTYNEQRFIATCLENLIAQGAGVYLIDNCSTDRTVEIAERYRGRGLIDIETLPRDGMFSLRAQLARKEELLQVLDADWFMHVDADEIRLPPRSGMSLAGAFAEVESQGYNAVNFMEFVFVPTREDPDHDHPDFQRTMRWYYPYELFFPQRLNAWKRQDEPVELAWSGGHQVRFKGLRMYPQPFLMRHYFFLSREHAVEKFIRRVYDPAEVAAGWSGWRARLPRTLGPEQISLPSRGELRFYTCDDELDASHPRSRHILADLAPEPRPAAAAPRWPGGSLVSRVVRRGLQVRMGGRRRTSDHRCGDEPSASSKSTGGP